MRFRAPDKVKEFIECESGVVFVEALIAIPTMTFLTVGILEFANMMWQRQQLQVGVRDAARYMSRCRPQVDDGTGTGTSYMPCSEDIARDIAFYGYPNPPAGTSRRVPTWDADAELTFSPDENSLPFDPVPGSIITVTGTAPYSGSPVMSWVLNYTPTISYTVEMRYIGW